MQRLRISKTFLLSSLSVSPLRKKALNSWSALQDSYYSAKDIFERHKVVFTISTSLASVLTAWAGYSLRIYQQKKIDDKLASIEKEISIFDINIYLKDSIKDLKLLNKNHEHAEIKKIVESGSMASSLLIGGTTLVVGYGMGWRGGRWYATRKFRQEQMKLLGQVKPRKWHLLGKIQPRGWQFEFLRRSLTRSRTSDRMVKMSDKIQKDALNAGNSGLAQE